MYGLGPSFPYFHASFFSNSVFGEQLAQLPNRQLFSPLPERVTGLPDIIALSGKGPLPTPYSSFEEIPSVDPSRIISPDNGAWTPTLPEGLTLRLLKGLSIPPPPGNPPLDTASGRKSCPEGLVDTRSLKLDP